jgi:hypothetical protein
VLVSRLAGSQCCRTTPVIIALSSTSPERELHRPG